MNKYPVWLDCDVGVDDAIAIMAAHRMAEMRVVILSRVVCSFFTVQTPFQVRFR